MSKAIPNATGNDDDDGDYRCYNNDIALLPEESDKFKVIILCLKIN